MNYVKYMATRDGVEKIKIGNKELPSTKKQAKLIREILSDFPDTKTLFEYKDYIKNATRENASNFIATAMEYNLDAMLTKRNYVDYIANRPGVEKLNENGMFSDKDGTIDLKDLAEEVGNHSGNVWTHIISLRREDATRLGYDHADAWINICRAKRNEMAQQMSIHPENLKWYAAYHNEGHHPHIHMIVYSKNEREGYVTQESIAKMRSSFANDIFKQDLIQIFKGQSIVRDTLKDITKETFQSLINNMNHPKCNLNELQKTILDLKEALNNFSGKKVYGFLPKLAKEHVNKIVDCLEHEENIKQLLEVWYMKKDDIYNTYRDNVPEHYTLSSIPEFKSIKNTIIQLVSDMDNFILPEEDMTEEDDENDRIQYDEILSCDYSPSMKFEESLFAKYKMEWNDDYKEAMKYLYGTDEIKKDFDKAKEMFELEQEEGNVLAIYELANMYERGIGVNKEQDKSFILFQFAYDGFTSINEDTDKEKIKEYTNYRLGKMYLYGQGVEQDYINAHASFEGAPNNVYALYNLGCIYNRGLGVEINHDIAFNYFMQSKDNPYSAYAAAELIGKNKVISDKDRNALYELAYQGFDSYERGSHDDNLQYRLGKMNYEGKGTEQNIEKSIDYLESSAEMKNENAKYLLAKIYLEFSMTDKVPQAISWLEELAEKEVIYACTLLAKEYRSGVNVVADISKAIFYATKSAEQNDLYAQYQLYKIYFTEMGYINIPLALSYLEKVANSGYEVAQYQLGKLYVQGEFVEKNIERGIDWLLKSANQGNQFAQYHLGKLYILGETVEKNIEMGINWLQRSADQGNQFAQYALGKLFLFGKDVLQDKEKAIYYLTESAEQGNEFAKYLLDHMDDYHGQPLTLLTTRLFYHIQNIFANQMLADPSNPLLQVDSKLRKKIQQKRAALGHKNDDRCARQTNN